MNNELGYPDAVWTLFRSTPRAGRFDAGTPDLVCAESGSPAGAFRLRLECRLAGGRIAEARFQAHGCPYTIAVGAWLAQWCEGRRQPGEASPPLAALRAELEIPEDRAHCWLMAQDLLRALKVVSA